MRFHIIYTPSTVRTHTLFLPSLLTFSDYRFCLVANGCGHEEQRLLAELAARDTGRYFSQLNSALLAAKPPPALPLFANGEVRRKLRRATADFMARQTNLAE